MRGIMPLFCYEMCIIIFCSINKKFMKLVFQKKFHYTNGNSSAAVRVFKCTPRLQSGNALVVNGDLLISKSNTLSLLLYHWPGGLGITRFPVFNRVKHLYCITQASIKRKASQLAALKSAFAHPAISPRIYHKQEHGIVHEYSLFNLFQQSADTTYDASFCLLYFE